MVVEWLNCWTGNSHISLDSWLIVPPTSHHFPTKHLPNTSASSTQVCNRARMGVGPGAIDMISIQVDGSLGQVVAILLSAQAHKGKEHQRDERNLRLKQRDSERETESTESTERGCS